MKQLALIFLALLSFALSSPAGKRGLAMMEYLGGNRECNTNLSHWHAYWKMYNELRRNYSSVRMTNVEGFRQMLYDNVLRNHTRALECASGVIAGYAFLGDYFSSLDRGISMNIVITRLRS